MTQAVSEILPEAGQLTAAELVDRLVEETPLEIGAAPIAEVRRRMASVESGEVTLVPGEEALARVRELVIAARTVS